MEKDYIPKVTEKKPLGLFKPGWYMAAECKFLALYNSKYSISSPFYKWKFIYAGAPVTVQF
uniref:Uncharacterized protein n=1 Tax=Anguilla anguilla TaxID=7936 RepID=A0A0E9XPA5_ANGAN